MWLSHKGQCRFLEAEVEGGAEKQGPVSGDMLAFWGLNVYSIGLCLMVETVANTNDLFSENIIDIHSFGIFFKIHNYIE